MKQRSHGRGLSVAILLAAVLALFHWSSDFVVSFVPSLRPASIPRSLAASPQSPRLRHATERSDSVVVSAALSGKPMEMSESLLSIDMPADFSEQFKNVHWIWQHAYQRFQCAQLASNSISDEDLPRAWELFYTLGAVPHNEVEDELFFPFVKSLDGGEMAVDSLTNEHEQLDAKAVKVEEVFKGGGSGARGLVKEWAQMYAEHIDHEEQLLVPIVLSGMRADLWKDVAPKIKKKSSSSPGGKMSLSLFQELSQHPLLGQQYANSFPAFLRWILIPAFSKTNSDYADHRRIFGPIPAKSLALL